MGSTQDATLNEAGDSAMLAGMFWASSPESLHDAECVAAVLGISRTTLDINRMRNTGIPYVRIGRIVRYKKSDVLAFVDKNRHEPKQA